MLDLNVMTRRGVAEHALDRLTVTVPRELRLDCGTALLLCRSGGLEVELADGRVRLGPDDALLLDPCPPEPLHLRPAAGAALFVVRLRPAR